MNLTLTLSIIGGMVFYIITVHFFIRYEYRSDLLVLFKTK